MDKEKFESEEERLQWCKNMTERIYTKYKFESETEYFHWCEDMVERIYISAYIAMYDEGVRKVIDEIGSKLHCSEGEEMYE